MPAETEITEGNLRFRFGDGWRVLRYDDHPDTRAHLGRLASRKAVDFVALRDDRLFLIEVKDFRGNRIENKPRLAGGVLAEEVALKAHDTLAGLVLARRGEEADPLWSQALDALRPGGRRPYVVLWLEDDAAWRAAPRDRVGVGVLRQGLAQRCSSLSARAAVACAADPVLPGVTAANLPGSA